MRALRLASTTSALVRALLGCARPNFPYSVIIIAFGTRFRLIFPSSLHPLLYANTPTLGVTFRALQEFAGFSLLHLKLQQKTNLHPIRVCVHQDSSESDTEKKNAITPAIRVEILV